MQMKKIKQLLNELEFAVLMFFLSPAKRALILREMRREIAFQVEAERWQR